MAERLTNGDEGRREGVGPDPGVCVLGQIRFAMVVAAAKVRTIPVPRSVALGRCYQVTARPVEPRSSSRVVAKCREIRRSWMARLIGVGGE